MKRKESGENKIYIGFKKVILQVFLLNHILSVIVCAKEALVQALDSELNDFEDAIQNFSAVQHGEVQAVITRNSRDYWKNSVAVFTPDEFLTAL